MRTKRDTAPIFQLADLDRLAARLAAVDLPPEDRAVLDGVIALGRSAVAAASAAPRVGSTPVGGDLADTAEAFRRALSPGPRATVTGVPPHA